MVEGADDEHVVRNLRRKLAHDLRFDQVAKNGCPNLLNAISSEMKSPGRQALGILVDANDNISARWQAVGDRLRKEKMTVPTAPSSGGTIITGESGQPRVGIWLMPDNETPGELEDFVVQLLPDDDPVWPLAQQFIEGIPCEHRDFKNKEVRAKLYSWLATRRQSPQMGEAIRNGALDARAPIAIRFVDWLKRLFEP